MHLRLINNAIPPNLYSFVIIMLICLHKKRSCITCIKCLSKKLAQLLSTYRNITVEDIFRWRMHTESLLLVFNYAHMPTKRVAAIMNKELLSHSLKAVGCILCDFNYGLTHD